MTTTENQMNGLALVEFNDNSENEELIIPENLEELSTEELNELAEKANEAFDAIYADGKAELSDEDLATLADITEGIEAINAENVSRETLAAERAEKAAELASRLRSKDTENSEEEENMSETEIDDSAENSETDEENVSETKEVAQEVKEDAELEAVAASGAEKQARKTTRIPFRSVARTPQTSHANKEELGIKSVLFAAGEGTGIAPGTGIDFKQASKALDRKLGSFNKTQYRNAASRNMHIKEQQALAVVKRTFPEELQIKDGGFDEVERAIKFATDQSRLTGGSLIAAGGWCAPSENTYDLLELESRDGLLSLPEVNVKRGGLNIPVSPSFADIFSSFAGFSFSESEAEEGKYAPGAGPEDPNQEGDKPCVQIGCPDWEDHRLHIDGLCISANLIQRRGYPEYQERIIRGALIAHEHRLNGRMIAKMAGDSTNVTMPSQQAGTAAPVLTSIELQTEHYRATHRLGRNVTLEAVFPFWVRGAIRADLARRQGVDLLGVTDQQINSWFTLRGIAAQFVYNWQDISGTDANSFNAFPSTVDFMLYTAGTWLRGADDIITLDTLYDSTLLAQNEFTALFTEEGWFVAKRGIDSRKVTVSIEANGATHAGVAIEHNGVGGPIVIEDTGENLPTGG